MINRWLLTITMAGSVIITVSAQDDDPIIHQKSTAESVMKDLDLSTHIRETTNLLVISDLPEAQADQLASYLQRQHDVTWKVLKLKPEDRSWSGKLAVYVLSNRSDFGSFLRQVEKRQPADRHESTSIWLKGDAPHVVVAVGLGEDEDYLVRKSLREISVMLLQMKAGATAKLPHWIEEGFVKSLQMRSGTREARAQRAKMLQHVRNSPVKDAWEADDERGELLAASFMDYLIFGVADTEKSRAFLRGFSPGEGNQEPNPWKAMEIAGMDQKQVESGWRRWLLTGR